MVVDNTIEQIDTTLIIEQINKAKKAFITDFYTMSVGEIISLYKEGELDINPDFQRAFRWSSEQQTRLIESILIGIPLPSIFVYQNKVGKWEVVDGVQRLSTIFAFVGILPNEPATILEETKVLPYLKDMTWKNLPSEIQLDFKRARLEVKIIKHLSDKDAKYEVFQRLNSGASALSGQEFRNALLIMQNKEFYNWMLELSQYPKFQTCVNLTDRWLEEKYDQELVLRLFIFSMYSFKKGKIDNFINECIFYSPDSLFSKIDSKEFNLSKEKQKFEKTFSLLSESGGETIFQKKGRGQQFLESYYEAIAIGLYTNIDSYTDGDVEIIKQKITNLENEKDFSMYKGGSGKTSEARIKNVVSFGSTYFKKPV
jgi:uncharacterized protein with ParB-like and HNH nuclease domain